MQGQATYRGFADGTYVYKCGERWGEELANTYDAEEYAATVTLTADFAANTLSGCIGCLGDIAIRRSHPQQLLGDEAQELAASPADYELHLGAVSFNPEDGTFENLVFSDLASHVSEFRCRNIRRESKHVEFLNSLRNTCISTYIQENSQ